MARAYIEEPESVIVMKIVNNNAGSIGYKREVEEHISAIDLSHRGRLLIRTLLDSFEVKSPKGSYLCLVYPPIRELLSVY
ncbi:uncharacterized protein N7498_004697 [Penicillium cinerascens]|uniref:Uncharacterized protein n=1 Tax=Penicillium cinerascens TaxID=70096 RepID=A0A9W9MM42_9EURO|nr:uncharacterized protein N7498_004697 [Penicillium cinerascens]KAJ5203818.1 hypothetical protein N7498_004697 [Penicillium cinerascens]